MTIFSDLYAAIYADTDIAVSAVYKTTVGMPTTVSVIMDEGVGFKDLGDSTMADRQVILHVLKSEVSSPVTGETFTIATTTYTVDQVVEDNGLEIQLAVK